MLNKKLADLPTPERHRIRDADIQLYAHMLAQTHESGKMIAELKGHPQLKECKEEFEALCKMYIDEFLDCRNKVKKLPIGVIESIHAGRTAEPLFREAFKNRAQTSLLNDGIYTHSYTRLVIKNQNGTKAIHLNSQLKSVVTCHMGVQKIRERRDPKNQTTIENVTGDLKMKWDPVARTLNNKRFLCSVQEMDELIQKGRNISGLNPPDGFFKFDPEKENMALKALRKNHTNLRALSGILNNIKNQQHPNGQTYQELVEETASLWTEDDLHTLDEMYFDKNETLPHFVIKEMIEKDMKPKGLILLKIKGQLHKIKDLLNADVLIKYERGEKIQTKDLVKILQRKPEIAEDIRVQTSFENLEEALKIIDRMKNCKDNLTKAIEEIKYPSIGKT